MADQATTTGAAELIASLEAQLRTTPLSVKPYEHATLMFRLGLAHAESNTADPSSGLRKALACYEVAAGVFDPRIDPVEHARVLNVAGAAHRGLGDRRRAAALFERAAELLEDRARSDELAAVWNNIGLVRLELGENDAAVEACGRALLLFDPSSAEGRRGRVAALQTRATAHASQPDGSGLDEALADLSAAAGEVDREEAPYHYGLIHHSLGTTYTAMAASGPQAEASAHLRRAVLAFSESLVVFSRPSFPYQHALAKHNLGRALSALGDDTNLRRAMACFEDAAAILHPQSHPDAWRHAMESLRDCESLLAGRYPGRSRTQHFVELVAEGNDGEARALLRDRLTRFLDLPPAQRDAAFADFALTVGRSAPETARSVLAAALDVLVELPSGALDVALRAVVFANRSLGDSQEEADRALDQAVSDALVGPQRVWVRDFLYSLDWERP
ncbi:MAG: tetratricopeptide repeat protein [Acidimicrobiia bacterium]